MPAPGYVFRDGGTTPPAEGEAVRESVESKSTRPRASTVGKSPVTAEPPSPRPSTSRARRTFSILNRRSSVSTTASASTGQPAQHHEIRSLLTTGVLGGGGGSSNGSSKRTSHDQRRQLNDSLAQPGSVVNNNEFVRGVGGDTVNGVGIHVHAAKEDVDTGKLRASIERLHNSVVVDLVTLSGHLSRLRTWQHPAHTGAYAAVYALAWVFNSFVPALLLGTIILIAAPEVRSSVFPPVATTDQHTVTVPDGQAKPSKRVSGSATPSASAVAITNGSIYGRSSLDKSTGGELTEPQIRTHLLHTFDLISDMWERFGNLVSPTPPFSHNKRLELAAILIPVFLLSPAITLQQVVRVVSFLFGVAFFCKPVIHHATDLLDVHVPEWRKYLDPRNTILHRVPNKAELAAVLNPVAANGAHGVNGVNGNNLLPGRGSLKIVAATPTRLRATSTSTSTVASNPSIASPVPTSISKSIAAAAPVSVSRPSLSSVAVPPVPPVPASLQSPVSPQSATATSPNNNINNTNTNYPPSSFPGSGAQTAAPLSRSQSQGRTRTRSLSRSRLGRRLASVLHRRNSKGQDDTHDNINVNPDQDQGRHSVSDLQREKHDSQISAISTTGTVGTGTNGDATTTTRTTTTAGAAAEATNVDNGSK